MRIFLILQDDPIFLYEDISKLIINANIIGATVLSQRLPKDRLTDTVCRYANVFGVVGLVKLAALVFWFKYIKRRNLKKLLSDSGVTVFSESDVNSSRFISIVKMHSPDLLVSIACPQKIRSELLAVPTTGSINLHGGYLPDYPGVFTPFWNLLHGALDAGCTIHWMNDSIDGGDIIKRMSFPISKEMSIMEIYKLISKVGVGLLVDALELIRTNSFENIKNTAGAATYNTFPTREDRRRFKQKGLRAI